MFALFPKDIHCSKSHEFPTSRGEETKQDFSTIMQESLTDSDLDFFIPFNYTETQATSLKSFFPREAHGVIH